MQKKRKIIREVVMCESGSHVEMQFTMVCGCTKSVAIARRFQNHSDGIAGSIFILDAQRHRTISQIAFLGNCCEIITRDNNIEKKRILRRIPQHNGGNIITRVILA